MRRYLIFIGTFFLSTIAIYIFFIGIILLLIDNNPSFANQPPSLIIMFIIFFTIPALIAYYVAFELRKHKKPEEGAVIEAKKEPKIKEKSHWLFALIASTAIIGGIVGLLFIFPPIKIAPYSFTEVNDNEFKKNATPSPTQITDETATWKTPSPTSIILNEIYKDKDFGYSIQYPKDWRFRRTYGKDIKKNGITDILSGIDIHNGTATYTTTSIVVNVLDAHKLSDIDNWIAKYDYNYPKNSKKEKIQFNNISALKYTYQLALDRDNEAIYFISGEYAYRIFYYETGGISEATRSVINSFQP